MREKLGEAFVRTTTNLWAMKAVRFMHWEDILATRASRLKASEIRELLKLIGQPGVISFAGGIPDGDLFPVQEFQQAFADMCEGDNASIALQYATSEGHLPLRQWIVGEMEKLGIPCDTGNVIITSGSQQALDYLGKLFLSPGDTALVQWPTYLGALSAFNAYEPVYDRLDTNSLRSPESYRTAADGGRVKFAYLSSDFANPTGESIDRTARTKLLDLARDLDIAIIEDAAYQSLRYDGDSIPPILALDIEREGSIEATRTLYCGSFSKTLSPGLRVGWVCGAQSVISRLVLMKQASDLHSGVVNQMAIADVAAKAFDKQIEKIRPVYRQRRDCMLDALAREMPPGISWTRPEGGMFIWITLPDDMNSVELLANALQDEKVAFIPGSAFFADRSGANTLRLSFSNTTEEKIEQGITRLGKVVRHALAS